MTIEYEHLIGRLFTGIGQQDCFKLARDFFADNFDIHIRDYARPHDWSSDKLDLMEMLHEHAGFEKITDWKIKDLRPADVLCVAVGESNPNHFAIFVGDNTIIHHVYGQMSRSEPMRDFWRNQTCYVLRHKEVPDMRPILPDVQLESLIDARNNPELG